MTLAALEAGGRLGGGPRAPHLCCPSSVLLLLPGQRLLPGHRGAPCPSPSLSSTSTWPIHREPGGRGVLRGSVSTGPCIPGTPPLQGPCSLKAALRGPRLLNPGWLPAGTTEKIFGEKRELYDAYVDNQNGRRTTTTCSRQAEDQQRRPGEVPAAQ